MFESESLKIVIKVLVFFDVSIKSVFQQVSGHADLNSQSLYL